MRVCFESLCFASQRLVENDDEATGQSQSRAQNRAQSRGLGPIQVAGPQSIGAPATSALVVVDSMGSVQELQALLADKDVLIRDLEAALRKREEEMVQLRSHLDKFQSVFPYSYTQLNNNLSAPSSPSSPPYAPPYLQPTGPRPRKQRAQGISAEPWSVHELDLQDFPTIDKSDR